MRSENQYRSLMILGRQPAISLAELESVLGAASVTPFGSHCISSARSEEIPSSRLGGSIKTAKLLFNIQSTDWQVVENYLLSAAPKHAKDLPPGKLTVGISVYGLDVKVSTINQTGLRLKKIIKKDRPVRIVPNKELFLNAAQVMHNNLVSAANWELLIVSDGKETYLAQTTFVQDIESYTGRDQLRPKRDTLVGMLPPKLAQVIINLASGNLTASRQDEHGVLLDPFCGTGVLVQEALLSGFIVVGSDIDKRMVAYTKENTDWLGQRYSFTGKLNNLLVADATSHQWPEKVAYVASEIYLGPILKGRVSTQNISSAKVEVNKILFGFLNNLAPQINEGTRICLAVPCWDAGDQFEHLPIIDHLADLGYNRVSFASAKTEELIYHRPGQAVARELLVLTRN